MVQILLESHRQCRAVHQATLVSSAVLGSTELSSRRVRANLLEADTMMGRMVRLVLVQDTIVVALGEGFAKGK